VEAARCAIFRNAGKKKKPFRKSLNPKTSEFLTDTQITLS